MTFTVEQQKANRKKWVKALRSGKYEQGQTFLRSNDNKYCCLGVLTELAGCDWFAGESSFWADEDSQCGAPARAMDWVGLKDSLGEYSGDALYELNDTEGKTFSEIADIIESEPPGLFTA